MGRPRCCDKANVKRGPWTPEEDAKILAYVASHGIGNWTSVPQKAGLNRCGKSCRLRWTNYLRPDLKHDNFTPEEEECILELHKTIGSRWCLKSLRGFFLIVPYNIHVFDWSEVLKKDGSSGIHGMAKANLLRTNSPPPRLQFSQISTTSRCPFVITLSYKPRSGNNVDSEKKRDFLEEYGLNPDDYLTKPSSKIKRREQGRTGNGKEMPAEEPRTFRETHKLLQVLGGNARRKKLLSPKGIDVRPMMEVVKAATFSILQAAGGSPQYLRPGRWLDLYSGTGSVGIEAMSRGCSEVHFVEMDPWVISDVLRPNLESTGFLDVSVIHSVRVETFLENADRLVGKHGIFDYISVTPPYTLVDYAVLMAQISKSSIVGENTFIVVEYPLRTDMLDSCGHLVKIADRRFGRTHLAIYGPTWAQKKNLCCFRLFLG
ncbi:hypothetical protein F511_02315 [Dorcoceras hygrometricum]|uniref:Uncharacterized protein n=1 Tax=Dorcoceras hygrometricum TaxID=472368 RepID=A0A2Z7CG21_9LAMI|nr:hypothetical protein F511_02315 [Dorcoceras hygrometricum]